MLEYAKISRMIEYQKKGLWPLGRYPRGNKTGIKNKIEDIARIIFNKGPLRSGHCYSLLDIPTEVLRMGTRGWEYPWVLDILSSNLSNNARILDCGCGQSQLLAEFHRRGFDISGLDFFVTDQELRNGKFGVPVSFRKKMEGKVHFINGGMYEIPADDNTFDAATCISVMEHIVINTKDDPQYHLKCLDEMKRVLKPDGLLLCTYDTILNREVVYGGTKEWGENGWYYIDDIKHLNMTFLRQDAKFVTREDIDRDEDTFFIPPDMYFQLGYGEGFNNFGEFHHLTSVGFVLIK